MLSNCFVKRAPKLVNFHKKHDYLSSEKVDIDGRIVSRSIYVTDDPETRLVGFSVEQFYLENLVNNGVELKSATLYGGDLLATTHVVREFARLNSLKSQLNETD